MSSKIVVAAFTAITVLLVVMTWLIYDAPGIFWRLVKTTWEQEKRRRERRT